MFSKKGTSVDYPFYKIVGDGGLSSKNIGEGRFIPSLIIDIENDTIISELIKLHAEVPPGDTILQWSIEDTFFSPKTILLNIEFVRPMKISFGIEFQLSTQYALIDGIVQSRAFYLMTGKSENKVSELIDKSIMIEVPEMKFDLKWNEMLENILRKIYKNKGASRKDTKIYVSNHIKSMRDVWNGIR